MGCPIGIDLVDIPDHTDPPKSGVKKTLGVLTFRRMLTPF